MVKFNKYGEGRVFWNDQREDLFELSTKLNTKKGSVKMKIQIFGGRKGDHVLSVLLTPRRYLRILETYVVLCTIRS
jgi:hypothetical protein